MTYNIVEYDSFTPCWGKKGFFEVSAANNYPKIVFGRIVDGILYAIEAYNNGTPNADAHLEQVLLGVDSCACDYIHCDGCPYGPANEVLGACMFNLMDDVFVYLNAALRARGLKV